MDICIFTGGFRFGQTILPQFRSGNAQTHQDNHLCNSCIVQPAHIQSTCQLILLAVFLQATFEQVLSKLATQTLKMVSEEYQRTREGKTQDETIVFLQKRAQQLDYTSV